MSAQQTPGPWRIERHRHEGAAYCVVLRGYGSAAEYMRTRFGAIQRFTASEARTAIATAGGAS